MKIVYAIVGAFLAAPGFALAQTYPVKPIRVIVPYPPGGGTDLVARMVAKQIHEQLGQPVVVDNRPGAGGNIGTDAVAKAAPDGYTLGIATPGPLTIAAGLQSNLPYDPATSFTPVALIAQQPIVLLTHPSLPARSVKELVALAKARPGELNAAVTTATVPHLLTELFKSTSATRFATIGYKGGVQARTDLLAGRVELMFSVLVTAMPFIKPPRVRALAIASPQRSALIPDVPTMRESGFPTIQGAVWAGVIGPAGLPQPVVQRLSDSISKTLGTAETKHFIESLAMDPVIAGPAEFQRFMREELSLWRKVIKSSNITVSD